MWRRSEELQFEIGRWFCVGLLEIRLEFDLYLVVARRQINGLTGMEDVRTVHCQHLGVIDKDFHRS